MLNWPPTGWVNLMLVDCAIPPILVGHGHLCFLRSSPPLLRYVTSHASCYNFDRKPSFHIIISLLLLIDLHLLPISYYSVLTDHVRLPCIIDTYLTSPPFFLSIISLIHTSVKIVSSHYLNYYFYPYNDEMLPTAALPTCSVTGWGTVGC